MPIRGDRLRWPPRPGRRSADASTRRSPSTEEQQAEPQQPLRQPDERDASARSQLSEPRAVIKQAHDDIESGQEDTDCRVHAVEVLDAASKTRENSGGDS